MTKNIKINAIRYNGEVVDIDRLEINYNIFDETYVGTIDKYVNDFVNVSKGKVVNKSPLVKEDNKSCNQWRGPKETRKNPGGWDCAIYACHCDGTTCKEKCDYYNKRGAFSYRK